MKKCLFPLLILVCDVSLYGQIGWDWVIDAQCDRWTYGLGVQVDESLNIYLTGSFEREMKLGGMTVQANESLNEQAYVAKLDKNGVALWIKHFGGNDYDHSSTIEIDENGNIYVAGSYGNSGASGSSKTFLRKLSPTGATIWERQMNSTYHWEEVPDKLSIFDNEIYVSTPQYIYSYNLDGEQQIGLNHKNSFVKTFKDGSIIVGSRGGALTFYHHDLRESDGMLIWQNEIYSFSGTKIKLNDIIKNDQDIYLTGYFDGPLVVNDQEIFGDTYINMFLVKIDLNGNLIWAKQGGGTNWDEGKSMILTKSGNLLVTGLFRNEAFFEGTVYGGIGRFNQIFVASYSSDNGDLVQVLEAGGEEDDFANAIIESPNGDVFITGALDPRPSVNFGEILIYRANNGNVDAFLAKLTKPALIANLKGSVFEDGEPAFTHVNVYKLEQESAELIYSQPTFNDGSFRIQLYTPGSYIIKSDLLYGGYISTYYPSEFNWVNSPVFNIDSDTTITNLDIHRIGLPPLNGVHSISGTIFDQDSIPVRFVDMFLLSDDDLPKAYIRADTLANYVFNDIPDGKYKILVDTTGFQMSSYHSFSLGNEGGRTSTSQTGIQLNNKNYIIINGQIIPIDEYLIRKSIDNLTLFPNPTSGIVKFDRKGLNLPDSRVTVFNNNGTAVLSKTLKEDQFNIQDLPNGLYFIKIDIEDRSVWRRVILMK